MSTDTARAADVELAVRAVEDPEYPGVTIDDLGMVERVTVHDGAVEVDLVPTMLGCPALAMIEADIRRAVTSAAPGATVAVRTLHRTWDASRVSDRGRAALGSVFGVTLRSSSGGLRCPVCGSEDLQLRSPVGAARCRAVHWCPSCRNAVEELRA